MEELQERIRITAQGRDVTVAIEGGPADLVFSAGQPLDLSTVQIGERSEEYAITLDFDHPEEECAAARCNPRLGRLHVHLRNVSIRLRDDGFVVDGDLAGWVGYTTLYTTLQRGNIDGGN